MAAKKSPTAHRPPKTKSDVAIATTPPAPSPNPLQQAIDHAQQHQAAWADFARRFVATWKKAVALKAKMPDVDEVAPKPANLDDIDIGKAVNALDKGLRILSSKTASAIPDFGTESTTPSSLTAGAIQAIALTLESCGGKTTAAKFSSDLDTIKNAPNTFRVEVVRLLRTAIANLKPQAESKVASECVKDFPEKRNEAWELYRAAYNADCKTIPSEATEGFQGLLLNQLEAEQPKPKLKANDEPLTDRDREFLVCLLAEAAIDKGSALHLENIPSKQGVKVSKGYWGRSSAKTSRLGLTTNSGRGQNSVVWITPHGTARAEKELQEQQIAKRE